MKNTKHTENLDNSTPQEITSQSKRKILTSIGVSSGILGASALSQQWTKPIVNSIILPAHAQSTPMTTMAMGTTDMMGMPDPTTTMMPDPTTTMMPTTATPAAMSRLKAVRSQVSTEVGDGASIMYHVSLTEQPLADVTVAVTVTSTPAITPDPASLTFTRANYMTEQSVTIAAAEGTVPNNPEVTVKFAASGGGYGKEDSAMDMVTIVENDDAAPTALSAMAGTGMVTISWTAPATAKPVVRYIVQVEAGNDPPAAPTGDVANGGPVNGVYTLNTSATSAMFTVPGGVAYSYTVNAVFGNGDNADTYGTAPSTMPVRSN